MMTNSQNGFSRRDAGNAKNKVFSYSSVILRMDIHDLNPGT